MSAESDRSVRGYRAASESLDERPSVATREAILAAAARQVQSRPHDLRDPPAARARSRPRWPYAAAAAVLLSTLAVMMATRTEQEMPSFTDTSVDAGRAAAPATEPAPAKPDAAAQPAVTAERAAADAAPASAAPVQPAPKIALPTSRPTQAARAPATPAPPAPPMTDAESKVNAPAEAARAKDEAAGMRTAPALAGSVEAPSAAAGAASASLAKRQSAPLNESAERRRDEVGAAVGRSAPRAASGALASDARIEADQSASEWLDRIVKLRRAGRHEEADAELKRFRERFPQVTIPPEAQAPAGTR